MNVKTFQAGLKILLKELKAQNRSIHTIVAFENDLSHLFRFLEGERDVHSLQEVKLEDLKAFKKYQSEKHPPKTVSRRINSVKKFFDILNKKSVLPKNVALNLKHPKVTNPPPKILSPLEYRAIRDASRENPRLYAAIEILLQTGIRIGELVNIKLDDIQKDENGYTLTIEAYGSQPKRKVPFNEKAKKALDEWLAVRPKSNAPYVFVTRTHKRIIVRNLRSSINRIFRKAGISGISVNDIRNTFIAYHLARGYTPVQVAQLVGHKNLLTTMRYIKVAKEIKSHGKKSDFGLD